MDARRSRSDGVEDEGRCSEGGLGHVLDVAVGALVGVAKLTETGRWPDRGHGRQPDMARCAGEDMKRKRGMRQPMKISIIRDTIAGI